MSKVCFPLPYEWTDFPKFISKEGTFGAVRKHDIHTGVDLYTREGAPVHAMEDGEIVFIQPFTGAEAESPWWLYTMAILVEGPSGVLVYGEVAPDLNLKSTVKCGQKLGIVAPVLKPEDARPDIPGHSRFMLHMELYTSGTTNTTWWPLGQEKPSHLLDPMPLLVRAWNERSIQRTVT